MKGPSQWTPDEGGRREGMRVGGGWEEGGRRWEEGGRRVGEGGKREGGEGGRKRRVCPLTKYSCTSSAPSARLELRKHLKV